MGLTLSTALAADFLTILVLDFKGDFVDIPGRLGRDLWDHYSAADGFRISCGPPSGCAQYLGSWINEFTKILAAHLDFKYAEATLAATLRIAFKLLNGDALAEPPVIPSLRLVAELLDTLPRELIASKEEYLRTAQQKIHYLLRISGELFDAEEGFDIGTHLVQPRRCAVVDCTTLSPLLSQILVNLLAAWLMFPRVVKRETSPHTNFALIVDEADQFCSRDASLLYPEGYNELGRLIKQGREFGIFVAVGLSFLEQCSRFIGSNMSYHIVLNQSDPASVDEAARTLLEQNVRQLIASLDCGEAVYKEAMGPARHGMLIVTDHVPGATMARPDKFDQHPYKPSRGIADVPGLREKVDALVRVYRGAALVQSPRRSTPGSLSKLARQFLDRASLPENLFAPVHIVFRQMGNLAPATQLAILQELEHARLVQFAHVRIGKANVKLQEITEKGWAFLQKPVPAKGGKGALDHRHYEHWIAQCSVRRGCQDCGIEPRIPGTPYFGDAGYRKDGKLTIVQVIAHCDSNITHHVRASLIESNAVTTLLFVTPTKSQHDDIRAKIMADPELVFCIAHIQYDVVETYMKELFS